LSTSQPKRSHSCLAATLNHVPPSEAIRCPSMLRSSMPEASYRIDATKRSFTSMPSSARVLRVV
jgi:hypothetical protein